MGFFEKRNTSVLEVLIFIPTMSHAPASHLMRVGGQYQRKPAKPNHQRKAID